MTTPAPQTSSPYESPRAPMRPFVKALLSVGACVVIVGAWMGYMATQGGGSAGGGTGSMQLEAQWACEGAVEQNLKAPATAEHAGQSVTGSGPWTVVGAVDAENAFGALVRTSYTCTAVLQGETMLATLESIG